MKSDAKTKKIEDITGDDVYFCKEIEREAHILCVLHNEDGRKKFKYIVSRFKHDQDTYFFPDCNLDTMSFGKVKVWDDSYAIETNTDDNKKNKNKAEWEQKTSNPSW